MVFHRGNLFTVAIMVSLICLSGFGGVEALRPFKEEQWLKKEGLVLESLQKGPITPSRPSCPTYIPKSRCTLSVMNFAGGVAQAPPAAYPNVIAKFGVASTGDESQQLDSSS